MNSEYFRAVTKFDFLSNRESRLSVLHDLIVVIKLIIAMEDAGTLFMDDLILREKRMEVTMFLDNALDLLMTAYRDIQIQLHNDDEFLEEVELPF